MTVPVIGLQSPLLWHNSYCGAIAGPTVRVGPLALPHRSSKALTSYPQGAILSSEGRGKMNTKTDAIPTGAQEFDGAPFVSATNGTACLAASAPVSGLFVVASVCKVGPLSDGKMGMTMNRAMRIRQVMGYQKSARKN